MSLVVYVLEYGADRLSYSLCQQSMRRERRMEGGRGGQHTAR